MEPESRGHVKAVKPIRQRQECSEIVMINNKYQLIRLAGEEITIVRGMSTKAVQLGTSW